MKNAGKISQVKMAIPTAEEPTATATQPLAVLGYFWRSEIVEIDAKKEKFRATTKARNKDGVLINKAGTRPSSRFS